MYFSYHDYRKFIIACYTRCIRGRGGHSSYLQQSGNDFDIEYKADNSPLTIADKTSDATIEKHLKSTPYPILTEEKKALPFEERKKWEKLWIVDPLDGTKEFIKRNGEFTVNIALVENGLPTLGVIYVPIKKVFISERSIQVVTG